MASDQKRRALFRLILLLGLVVAIREALEIAHLGDDVSNDGMVVSCFQQAVHGALPGRVNREKRGRCGVCAVPVSPPRPPRVVEPPSKAGPFLILLFSLQRK